MEELYGDLLPTASSTSAGTGIKLPLYSRPPGASSTQKPKVTQAPATLDNGGKVGSTTTASRNPNGTEKVGSKAASTLLFKPRQTSIQTSTVKTNSVPVVDLSNKPPPSSSAVIEIAEKIMSSSSVEETSEAAIFNVHSSFDVSEPYDPRRPNDYLTYCDEREDAKRKKKLAEDNLKRLAEMENERQEMERKRNEAAETKDYQKLLEGQSQTGRGGRGRGLVNLPAWITQQIPVEQLESAQTSSEPSLPRSNGAEDSVKFQDAFEGKGKRKMVTSRPSRVLLLLNMVSEEEARADQGLTSEIKEECEKYGPVITCEKYIVNMNEFPYCPSTMKVRIFIHFEKQDAAIRAFKDLNGRFFGGRQVSASFFDEQRFGQHDLAPSRDEI